MVELEKTEAFVKKISNDTVNGKIFWEYISNLEDIQPESNSEIANLLLQHDFHSVDIANSYYAAIANGTIFVVKETFQSGRDGTIISGYNLYLLPEEQKILKVPCPKSTIYQLLNAIRSCLANTENEVEKFIDEYLQNS